MGRVLAEADASTVTPAGVSGRDGSQPAKGVFLVLCFPFGVFPAPASTIKKSLYVNKEYFLPLYSHKGSFYGGKSYRNLSEVIGIFKISPDRLRQVAKLVIPFKGYLGIR